LVGRTFGQPHIRRKIVADAIRHWYYVNAARNILGLPQSIGGEGKPPYPDATRGMDPNHEHPPLAKLMIAFSMLLIGNNGYGFRLPSVVFGTLSILVLYLLLKRVSGDKLLSLIAAFLFSFDNLVFVHSRIATLDIFVLFFMILGFYWYFGKNMILSGVAFALSTLCKIGGLYGILVVAIYHLGKAFLVKKDNNESLMHKFGDLERLIITYGISFIALLFVMDRFWVGYSSPIEHLTFILNYTRALVAQSPTGIQSQPWQWLLNQIQIPYLKVDVNKMVDSSVVGSYTSVHFNGAMNPLIIYLTLPSVLYAGYLFFSRRDDLSLFTVAWFAGTYLPFIPMALLWNRIMYLFYFLNTIPSVCMAITSMALDQKPPKIVMGLYLIAVVVMFVVMFPFKAVP
jgi:predicted membrane-bound dolichyl-phosphate-mannose-protein mannosyltransferase